MLGPDVLSAAGICSVPPGGRSARQPSGPPMRHRTGLGDLFQAGPCWSECRQAAGHLPSRAWTPVAGPESRWPASIQNAGLSPERQAQPRTPGPTQNARPNIMSGPLYRQEPSRWPIVFVGIRAQRQPGPLSAVTADADRPAINGRRECQRTARMSTHSGKEDPLGPRFLSSHGSLPPGRACCAPIRRSRASSRRA